MIPHENTKDLAEIPANIKNKLNIEPVRWIDDVLKLALEHLPEPAESEHPPSAATEGGKEPVRAH